MAQFIGTVSGTDIIVNSGSASTPSITFSGDENTGLFSPGADTVGITTGGTSRLTISGSAQTAGIGVLGNASITSNAYVPNVRSLSSTLYLTASGSNVAQRYMSTNGRLLVGNSLVFDNSVALSTGTHALISIPATLEQAAEGGNANIFAGFIHAGKTRINSAQSFSGMSAFAAQQKVTETGNITSAHNLFQAIGFQGTPLYTVQHNNTSTSAVPLLVGFMAEPRVFRESGSTGSTTIGIMAGFTTNPVNAGRAFFGLQQINAGFTVNKYAHFLAHSGDTNALVNNGGTLTEEVGVDLQNINIGTTKISLRSTGTEASMRHQGDVMIGSTAAPGVVTNTGIDSMVFQVVNDRRYVNDAAFVKYSNNDANHIYVARARGSLASPTTLNNGNPIMSLQTYGHNGSAFVHCASFNTEVDSATNVATGFEFKVRTKSGGSVSNSFELRSNMSAINYGRWGLIVTDAFTGTLTSDRHNYDPETVSGTGVPRAWWRLTADSVDRTITGIFPPNDQGANDCQYLHITNVGASNNIILANQSASSSATYRIITGTGADLSIGPDQNANLLYDQTSDRWRVMSRNF